MSERFGFDIEFDVPFSPEALRRAFQDMRDSIARDWDEFRDVLSFAEPPTPVDVEAWVERVLVGPEEGSLLSTVALPFSFSPRTSWAALLWVAKQRDSALSLRLSVIDRLVHESDQDREDWRKRVDPDFVPPDPNWRWRWDEERMEQEWIGPDEPTSGR